MFGGIKNTPWDLTWNQAGVKRLGSVLRSSQLQGKRHVAPWLKGGLLSFLQK